MITLSPTIILVPFIVAFLTFVMRFYFRESASSITNPSFILAITTILAAGLYLTLRITELLPPYSTLGFGLLGLAFLGTGITRIFRL